MESGANARLAKRKRVVQKKREALVDRAINTRKRFKFRAVGGDTGCPLIVFSQQSLSPLLHFHGLITPVLADWL